MTRILIETTTRGPVVRQRAFKEADLFDRLIVLLREPAQRLGIGQHEFDRCRPEAQAATADAGATTGLIVQGE